MRAPDTMKVTPEFESFSKRFSGGHNVALSVMLVSDLDTPVSAMLKLAQDQPYSYLFESVEGGANLGRYSFIGLNPDLIWRCAHGKAEINRDALKNPDKFEPCDAPPLESLRALMAECRVEGIENLPPAAVGLFGYLGYDMIRLVEDIPDALPDPLNIPDSIMIRPTVAVIFDNVKRTVTIVTPVWYRAGSDPKAAYDEGAKVLESTVQKLNGSMPASAVARPIAADIDGVVSCNTTTDEYDSIIEKTREYIFAGDIFQAVLSQRFERSFTLPAFSLYRSLRRLNPSPFLVYFNFKGFSLVCSSPEILVRLRDGKVTIRPIAGTRRRGKSEAEDKTLAADLLKDPKELAEHLMLLDLGRNDVGKVSEIGSVKVTDQFTIEYYSHVMHIVSNVEGKLRKGLDALDALFSGFPAGTVSGAPKIRAMEIIEELEKNRRSFYGGCIGYLGADGTLDSCIALRTGLVKDGKLYVQAGGGIVADSTAKGEHQESVNKARALLAAAEDAVKTAAEEKAA